jgi:hypothetical protein
MKINQLSPLSFTSKIKFVSDEEFKNRTAGESRDWSNRLYIGDPWDDVVVGSHALTEDIYGCNAGGLSNTISKDVVMFHFKPAAVKYSQDRFQDKIRNALSQMGQYTDKLGGLIIGGKIAASGDFNYENSKTLSQKLEELFGSVKASVTKFWGQTRSDAYTNIFYSGEEDVWYVNHKNGPIHSADDIKNAYFTIEVADQDEVYIGEQKIDKFDLKRGYRRISGGYELDLQPPNEYYQSQYDYTDPSLKERTKVKLFLGDFGQDPLTLWVEPKTESQMVMVLERMDEIKQAPLFRNVQQIQYDGQMPVEGFEEIAEGSNGKKVFEHKL